MIILSGASYIDAAIIPRATTVNARRNDSLHMDSSSDILANLLSQTSKRAISAPGVSIQLLPCSSPQNTMSLTTLCVGVHGRSSKIPANSGYRVDHGGFIKSYEASSASNSLPGLHDAVSQVSPRASNDKGSCVRILLFPMSLLWRPPPRRMAVSESNTVLLMTSYPDI